MALIGLLGRRRAGKDTVAKDLVENYGFVRMAFADVLKEFCATRCSVPVALFHDDDAKDAPCRGLGGKTPRQVIIEVADAARARDPDCWVKALAEKFKTIHDAGRSVVLSDVRYPNEYEWVKRNGGVLARVWRPGRRRPAPARPLHAEAAGAVALEGTTGTAVDQAINAHTSETALLGAAVDRTLVNLSGEWAYLRTQTRALAEQSGISPIHGFDFGARDDGGVLCGAGRS